MDQKLVSFLKDHLRYGSISLKNLSVQLSSLPADIRIQYDVSKFNLRKFLTEHKEDFVINSKDFVEIKQVTRESSPTSTTSNEIPPGVQEGVITGIHDHYGFVKPISFKSPVELFFSEHALLNNLRLEDLNYGDIMRFDSVLPGYKKNGDFSPEARQVWKVENGKQTSSEENSNASPSNSESTQLNVLDCWDEADPVDGFEVIKSKKKRRAKSQAENHLVGSGTVKSVFANHGFIKVNTSSDEVFFHRQYVKDYATCKDALSNCVLPGDLVTFSAVPSSKPSYDVKWEARSVVVLKENAAESLSRSSSVSELRLGSLEMNSSNSSLAHGSQDNAEIQSSPETTLPPTSESIFKNFQNSAFWESASSSLTEPNFSIFSQPQNIWNPVPRHQIRSPLTSSFPHSLYNGFVSGKDDGNLAFSEPVSSSVDAVTELQDSILSVVDATSKFGKGFDVPPRFRRPFESTVEKIPIEMPSTKSAFELPRECNNNEDCRPNIIEFHNCIGTTISVQNFFMCLNTKHGVLKVLSELVYVNGNKCKDLYNSFVDGESVQYDFVLIIDDNGVTHKYITLVWKGQPPDQKICRMTPEQCIDKYFIKITFHPENGHTIHNESSTFQGSSSLLSNGFPGFHFNTPVNGISSFGTDKIRQSLEEIPKCSEMLKEICNTLKALMEIEKLKLKKMTNETESA